MELPTLCMVMNPSEVSRQTVSNCIGFGNCLAHNIAMTSMTFASSRVLCRERGFSIYTNKPNTDPIGPPILAGVDGMERMWVLGVEVGCVLAVGAHLNVILSIYK